MGYVPPAEADKRYVFTAGDTMTGPLSVDADLTANWARLVYGADAGGYKITGVADPTTAQDAASKAYVDGRSSAAQCTESGSWINYIGSFQVTRSGSLVSLQGFLRWGGGSTSITAGAAYVVGTVPAGYRPKTNDPSGIALFSLNGTYGGLVACRSWVDEATGQITVHPTTGGSLATNGGWVILNQTYEGV